MAKNNKLRVIVFGYGRMGSNHVRILKDNPNFELVGVVEPRFKDGELPNSTGIPIYSSWDNLPACDCAIVATPTTNHFEPCSRLIELKIPVLVEKPVCASSTEANALCSLAAQNKVPLFVGHVERFNPAVRKLQEVVAHGWLGDPIHFSFTRVGGYPDHVVNKKNVLLDLAVHDLDIFQLFANPVTINACLCHSTFQENIFDTAEILARGKNGISGSIHVNWVTPTKIRSVRVTGTRGVCLVDYMLQTCTLLGGLLLGARSEPRTEFSSLIEAYKNSDRIEFGVAKEEPLRLELDAFYHALNGQPSHLCTGKEGALLTAMVEEAIGLFQRTAVAAI